LTFKTGFCIRSNCACNQEEPLSVSNEGRSREFKSILEGISQDLDRLVGNEYGEISQRWNSLDDAFEAEFGINSNFSNISEYDKAADIASRFLGPSIILYALGFEGSCLIELYALLERLAIEIASNAVTMNSSRREIIAKMLRRKSLNEVKKVLIDMAIWDKGDSRFLNQFTKIRDGTAHKNTDEISKVITGGRNLHFLDIDDALRDFDAALYIMASIRLMLKLFYYDAGEDKSNV
jgi:hypothetical protein